MPDTEFKIDQTVWYYNKNRGGVIECFYKGRLAELIGGEPKKTLLRVRGNSETVARRSTSVYPTKLAALEAQVRHLNAIIGGCDTRLDKATKDREITSAKLIDVMMEVHLLERE
jgi:hypothetical protein